MGDRVSIRFVNRDEPEWGRESVTLFSHWGGMDFVRQAEAYIDQLSSEVASNDDLRSGPLGRFEPNTVMVDFIREVTKGLSRVDGDLYLGANPRDGDNSDNGHHDIAVGDRPLPAAQKRY